MPLLHLLHRPQASPAREWGLLLLCLLPRSAPFSSSSSSTGLDLTTVSHASLMVGTMPVILAVGATLFAHERMDRTRLARARRLHRRSRADRNSARATPLRHKGEATLAGDLLVVLSLVIALFWAAASTSA